MEKKLLELLNLANTLNEKSSKLYAEIKYIADDSKRLEIVIRQKKDFIYIEKCEILLANKPIRKLDSIIKIFTCYIGGVCNE